MTTNPCFHCKRNTSQLRSGWPLRSGGHAQLCNQCAYEYENGTFCSTFHSQIPGWRKCNGCQKDIHCGCIMSVHLFEESDTGQGIICFTCKHQL